MEEFGFDVPFPQLIPILELYARRNMVYVTTGPISSYYWMGQKIADIVQNLNFQMLSAHDLKGEQDEEDFDGMRNQGDRDGESEGTDVDTGRRGRGHDDAEAVTEMVVSVVICTVCLMYSHSLLCAKSY